MVQSQSTPTTHYECNSNNANRIYDIAFHVWYQVHHHHSRITLYSAQPQIEAVYEMDVPNPKVVEAVIQSIELRSRQKELLSHQQHAAHQASEERKPVTTIDNTSTRAYSAPPVTASESSHQQALPSVRESALTAADGPLPGSPGKALSMRGVDDETASLASLKPSLHGSIASLDKTLDVDDDTWVVLDNIKDESRMGTSFSSDADLHDLDVLKDVRDSATSQTVNQFDDVDFTHMPHSISTSHAIVHAVSGPELAYGHELSEADLGYIAIPPLPHRLVKLKVANWAIETTRKKLDGILSFVVGDPTPNPVPIEIDVGFNSMMLL